MKMAKADKHDIEAAGRLLQILDCLSRGEFPATIEEMENEDEDIPTYFDPDDRAHLRALYDRLYAILDEDPGMPLRVIGGMCFVILYEKNQIIDPESDTLDLHPRFGADARDAARYRWLRDRRGSDIEVIGPEDDEPEQHLYEGALDAAIDAAMAQGGE